MSPALCLLSYPARELCDWSATHVNIPNRVVDNAISCGSARTTQTTL